MRRLLLGVLLLSACAPRDTPEVAACRAEVDADPEVRLLIAKGAGSPTFLAENQDTLRAARQRASLTCLRARGVIQPGGVERQKPL